MEGREAMHALDDMRAYPRRAMALQDRDLQSLRSSASGGAFAVLARAVLERGGAVFGAAIFDGGTVCHVCIRSIEKLIDLQGSKYVESNVGETYNECANLLASGIEVLYSGTPCQIAGLRTFLAKVLPQKFYEDKLLCVDLICHGTPKQELFKAYIDWLSEKKIADDGIHGYSFRSKLMGWGLYYHYCYFRKGKRLEELGPARDDPYYSAFSKGLIYRRCCYKCPFAKLERVADFTIGDYWGIEQVHPDFYDSRGVSAVLMNTTKAEAFFDERCADKCKWTSSSVEEIAMRNANLLKPTERSAEDENLATKVEQAVASGDFEMAFGKLLDPKLSMAAKIRKALPWRIARTLSKIR